MPGAAFRLALPALLLVAARAAVAEAPARAAEGQERQPFTVEMEVDVVSVTAVVFDKGGHLVHGLGPKDVELLEDGVAQELSLFREVSSEGDPAARVPLSVALVLDTSGSMSQSLHFLQEALLSFVYNLEDVDQALVVSFNDTVKGSADFTGDTDRLERFVDGLQAWGGTSLYDAVHYSLERIKDRSGRKALIIFSDGADTTSSLGERTVVDYARAVEATVYCIGFTSRDGTSSRGFLRRIASETGGQFFAPGKVGDLAKVFSEISEELKNNYLLAYAPKRAADRTWRRIELKVKRPGAEVRLRKGYFAVPRRRATDREAPRG